MKEFKIFESEEFTQVRTLVTEKEEILFNAKDVALNLGHTNYRRAIRKYCKNPIEIETPSDGGIQTMKFIAEPDVYRLIMKSQLPSAEKFETWVFEDVLPSIRKTGVYMTPTTLTELLQKPESITELLQMLVNETQEKQKLEQEIEEIQPKVDYYDKLVDAANLINLTTTAKELGVQPKEFISFLLDNGYAFRNTRQTILPYQTYVKRGYFEIKEFYKYGHLCLQTFLTAEGRSHFLTQFNVKSTDDFEQLMIE